MSVLLAILDRTLSSPNPNVSPDASSVACRAPVALYSTMRRQVWLGTLAGVATCVVLGAVLILGILGAADSVGGAEDIWEAAFSLVASIVITIMGAVLLRVGKMQDKWRLKLALAMDARAKGETPGTGGFLEWVRYMSQKYALFILPFITVLREGFEGVLFVVGVGIGLPASAILLSVAAGILLGCFVSYLIYM